MDVEAGHTGKRDSCLGKATSSAKLASAKLATAKANSHLGGAVAFPRWRDSAAAPKGGAARTGGCTLAGAATRVRGASGTE